MLYLCADITNFHIFFEKFRKRYENTRYIDLSKTPTHLLADECDSIVKHHKECCVCLGYVEPGWMLEPSHQTRLRKLFRKFPVGLILQYPESLPYSWKNEIDNIYKFSDLNQHGNTNSINNGCIVYNKSEI